MLDVGVVQADWYCVFAKTGPADSRNHADISCFIVDATARCLGGSHRRQDGVRGVDTGELILDSVRVPAANMVGEVGGFRLRCSGSTRCARSWPPRHRSRRRRAHVRGRVREATRAFGRTIADMQGIQWKIAELATEIEAARLLTYRAATMADKGKYTKEYVPFLSMAKYYASEVAVKVSGEALQMLGAPGT